MHGKNNIILIIVGVISLIVGSGALLLKLYEINVVFFQLIIWRDVIIFSLIAATGLILVSIGIWKELRFKNRSA